MTYLWVALYIDVLLILLVGIHRQNRARYASAPWIRHYVVSERPDDMEEIFRGAGLRNWNGFCWRCGGKGFWHEQIDGPDNLRIVYCKCLSTPTEGKP